MLYDPDLETYYTHRYDANGNLTQMVKTLGEQSETTGYESDYENRMTKVTLPDAATNESGYDGDRGSRRRTRFFYDGLNNAECSKGVNVYDA